VTRRKIRFRSETLAWAIFAQRAPILCGKRDVVRLRKIREKKVAYEIHTQPLFILHDVNDATTLFFVPPDFQRLSPAAFLLYAALITDLIRH